MWIMTVSDRRKKKYVRTEFERHKIKYLFWYDKMGNDCTRTSHLKAPNMFQTQQHIMSDFNPKLHLVFILYYFSLCLQVPSPIWKFLAWTDINDIDSVQISFFLSLFFLSLHSTMLSIAVFNASDSRLISHKNFSID